MKKILKFVLAGMFSVVFIFTSVIPVDAAQTSLNAYADGPTIDSDTIQIGEVECYLYGSASCVEAGLLGNSCYWKARQYGDLADAGTNTYVSFGSNGSVANIMGKVKMVIASKAQTYEKNAGPIPKYTQATTVLYY